MIKRGLLAFGLIIGFGGGAVAGLQEGLTAFAQGDYQRAMRELLPSAEQGEIVAMLAVGDMYALGQGVSQDLSQAVQWYRRAADRNDPTSQVVVGNLYLQGTGVEQSYAEAAVWYGKAAAQGSPDGLLNLGLLYADGLGVEQDVIKADVLMTRAADGLSEGSERWKLAARYLAALEARMTPSQRLEAKRLDRAW